MASSSNRIFFILPGAPASEGASAETLGGKAYGLLRLAQLGLQVPPAFVLETAHCRDYFARGGRLPDNMREILARGLARLEEATGRGFGSARKPLLVSVRSGAPVSMPGMMETILNIGLGEHSLHGLLRMTGNPRQARDCYRRLVRDFTEVVWGTEGKPFDALVEQHCAQESLGGPRELDSAALDRIVQESLELALALTGQPFPQDPMEQLLAAVEAVFRSWNGEKARHYRRLNGIDDTMGTAVTVQAMVFGNSGSTSGAGVGFTRDPASGENRLYVDFAFDAQGEDIVSGRHDVRDADALPRRLPAVAADLTRIKAVLEREFHDMQDFEFTVENGRLYLLQTRKGTRTPWAALKMAVEMVREGLIDPAEAAKRLDGLSPERLERTRFADGADTHPIAKGISAGIGVAAGAIALDPKRAASLAAEGRPTILVRDDIATSDIEGFAAAEGILTASGGRTSHGAVVARQLGKSCIVGCASLHIDAASRRCVIGEQRFAEGDEVSLDGNTGAVYRGRLPILQERPERELAELQRWREHARLDPTAP